VTLYALWTLAALDAAVLLAVLFRARWLRPVARWVLFTPDDD